MSRLLVAVAMAGFFTTTLHADVIPTRRAGDTGESAQKVTSRLLQLGVSPDAAKEQLQKLTDEQTAYFAGDPQRIQLVGQEISAENWGGQSDNFWWEWVFGIIFLGVVAGYIVWEVQGRTN
jgi:hypothetical protein